MTIYNYKTFVEYTLVQVMNRLKNHDEARYIVMQMWEPDDEFRKSVERLIEEVVNDNL